MAARSVASKRLAEIAESGWTSLPTATISTMVQNAQKRTGGEMPAGREGFDMSDGKSRPAAALADQDERRTRAVAGQGPDPGARRRRGAWSASRRSPINPSDLGLLLGPGRHVDGAGVGHARTRLWSPRRCRKLRCGPWRRGSISRMPVGNEGAGVVVGRARPEPPRRCWARPSPSSAARCTRSTAP